MLDSFNVFLVDKRWATEVLQWVLMDCPATRLQAACEAPEPTEPRSKAKSAGVHFVSPAAALHCKTWNGGWENQNTITIYINIPATLICCVAQLFSHILDLDLIGLSLWLNRKFSWESSHFSLPSPCWLLLACGWCCWIFIWAPVH